MFGVITCSIDEPYAVLGARMLNLPHNLIGFYYYEEKIPYINLYRTFDGTRVNYFSEGTTIQMLASYDTISDFRVYSFDEDTWRVDNNRVDLYHSFRECVLQSLMCGTISCDQQCAKLKGILLYILGLPVSYRIHNGYSRINDLIKNTTGESKSDNEQNNTNYDGVSHNTFMECNIVNNYYLKQGESVNTRTTINFIPNLSESEDYLNDLATAFVKLFSEDPRVRICILHNDILGNLCDKPTTVNDLHCSVSCDVHTNLARIKETILKLQSGFDSEQKETVKVDIHQLVCDYNALAEKIGDTERITSLKSSDLGSYNAVVYNPPHEPKTNITLSSGTLIVLPLKHYDFSGFSTDQLLDIHRHLMSLSDTSVQFNFLLDNLISEMAQRKQNRNRQSISNKQA